MGNRATIFGTSPATVNPTAVPREVRVQTQAAIHYQHGLSAWTAANDRHKKE
jgi:hypothetical protein